MQRDYLVRDRRPFSPELMISDLRLQFIASKTGSKEEKI